jgi:hypothetical protein
MTSLHHNVIEKTRDNNASIKKVSALLKLCMVKTPLVVKVNKAIQVYKGQGDGETK